MKDLNKILVIIATIIIAGLIIFVGNGIIKKSTQKPKNPIVTMEIEGYGVIKIELYPEIAPNTVKNFIKLANNGFYNNLTFHRIIQDFMIQGGDTKGDGTGKGMYSALDPNIQKDYEYSIKGEFYANGVNNKLKHTKGVISMARSDYSSVGMTEEGYNSASTQFFIMTSDNKSLDGYYTPFGKVIEGYDIVEKIAQVKMKQKDSDKEVAEGTPEVAPVIKTVTVDTLGVDYGMPEVQEAFDYNGYLQKMYGFSSDQM